MEEATTGLHTPPSSLARRRPFMSQSAIYVAAIAVLVFTIASLGTTCNIITYLATALHTLSYNVGLVIGILIGTLVKFPVAVIMILWIWFTATCEIGYKLTLYIFIKLPLRLATFILWTAPFKTIHFLTTQSRSFYLAALLGFILGTIVFLVVITIAMDHYDARSAGPKRASDQTIKDLGKIQVEDGGMNYCDEKAECAICMGVLEVGEWITFLPCGHWYHHPCIGSWLKKHASCPFCFKGVE